MGEVKTIKEVDDKTWYRFKILANQNKMKLGRFFKEMLEEYEEKNDPTWERILAGEKILLDQEAEELSKTLKKLRKEYGFRQ